MVVSLINFKEVILPLLLSIAGIVVYSIFVFNFYKFLALKNIFHLNLRQYNDFKSFLGDVYEVFLYFLEYLLILPFFIFVWFVIVVMILIFLNNNSGLEMILLLSMALVASIRVCAYYSENLAKDLAKLLPFALLAVFLSDPIFPSFSYFREIIFDLPGKLPTILYYFIFVFLLELILRIITFLKDMIIDGYYKDA